MATAAKARGPYIRADLENAPDDGQRYEVIDGYLYVSAAPGRVHQRATTRMATLLASAAPSGFEVLVGPSAVPFGDDTEMQRDVVVGRDEDFTEREVASPALVVEVLSPSTRLVDIHVKRVRFEAAGIPSCWIVDPATRPAEASLVAWESGDDRTYGLVAKATGDGAFSALRPFPVSVVPAALVR